jgi:nucleoside-diphosphate-sugar epimerase
MSSGIGNLTLVTGASGFIGGRLLAELGRNGVLSRTLSRTRHDSLGAFVGDLTDAASLKPVCEAVDTVFHCAGYAHAFSAANQNEAVRHQTINFEGTRNLVGAAGQSGVKRFVFLSSVKAMAEPGECCVDEDWPGRPETDYGRAKRAAEEVVIEAGDRYGMHVVNLRLAMVYGSGGRGNLERMGRLIRRGLFPPLPETGNHRSLVHVDDVVSAMRLVADDARANGKTYIVAGAEAPSGRQLYDAICEALGLSKVSWAVPAGVLQATGRLGTLAGRLSGRRLPLDSEIVERLLGSAWYSPARIERDLGWRARVSLSAGLREMLCEAPVR